MTAPLADACVRSFARAVRGMWATCRAVSLRDTVRGGVREIGPPTYLTACLLHVHTRVVHARCSPYTIPSYGGSSVVVAKDTALHFVLRSVCVCARMEHPTHDRHACIVVVA